MNKKDTLNTRQLDTLQLTNKLRVQATDSTKVDTLKTPKEFLEAIINKKSDDYISNDFVNKRATLYNNAELLYQDIELRAGIIIIDYSKNLAYAKGIIDSAGTYTQRPIFKQGAQESEQDSLVYNFKNEKAVIYNTKTEQTGVIITGDITKRENDSTLYINRARFTTSQKEKPDYHIATNNIKVVPGKKVVGGMSQLYLAEVPTPAILPFFYAPLSKETSESGLILPTWGENSNQGFFFQNGGYYFAISDYVDLAVLGDVYTNGSWGIRLESNYALRYKFNGSFSLRFENLISGQRGFPGFAKTNNFYVRWSHSQNAQSNPNARFSASVNLGSSQYFRQSLNEINQSQNVTNTFSSSISYYKKFVGTPFNMNMSLTHTQNTNTERIDMNLPSLQLSMDRIYPFAPKSGTKKNAIQNMGLTYNMDLQNRITTTDDEFFKADMFKNARSGVRHTASLSTNLKALNYITISPSANYSEVWVLKTIDKRFDDTLVEGSQVVTDTINGFDAFREYSTSISASTNIYGTFNFKKGRLKAIRHTLRPSISYSYRPDFSNFYDEVQRSNDPDDTQEFTRFEGGVFGQPSRGLSSSIGIRLNNVFEAKVMPKDSTETEAKKITLLNSLNFSTNYNMAADSLKWSPVSASANTSFFKKKLNVTMNARLDPYALNANGQRINTFNINNGGSLFRLTSASISSSYSISSDQLNKKKKDKAAEAPSDNADSKDLLGGDLTTRNSKFESTSSTPQKESKLAKLYQATIPWNLSFRHTFGYSNSRRQNDVSTNSLQFSGSVELSPKWNVGISSGYDFKNKGITPTSLNFERDLDSWRMSFNWIPFGRNSTYYFFIGVKASVLSDLKYDQRSVPDRRLF
ncbi:MAG: LPS-assembly protein LptD [Flavobacteriaceae bacterium]|nr:LPS-assembly protein LptD [Flavobacteriaceae bacterium]